MAQTRISPVFDSYKRQRRRILEDLDEVRLDVDRWLESNHPSDLNVSHVAELEGLHGKKALLLRLLHETDEAFTNQLLGLLAKAHEK